VIGFDASVRRLPGVSLAESLAEAVSGADVVLSLTSPMQALKTAREVAALISDSGAIYADLNQATPSTKRSLATNFPEGMFVDGSLAVSGSEADPELALSASGPATQKLADALSGLPITVDVVSAVPGDAAARALLRSLLVEGISNAVIDTLWAAETLGMQDWAFDEVLREFDGSSAASIKASLASTSKNFKPLQMEMQNVLEMLSESGYESTMLAPIQFNHGRIMHGKKIPHTK
ncbi:MAG: hypothetical protein RLZZ600_904, partial [Actinomycetota bacterium]